MKLKYFFIFALICATLINPNFASAIPQVKVSVISGTEGANPAEECENLYDGNIYTKWCVTYFSYAYTIFELSTPASIKGMRITTANDNSRYRGRNPRVFALYGSNKSSRPYANDNSWELIAYNNGDTLLEDVNYKTYDYRMQRESERYKYYKIEITETKGASVMQMSELSFISGKYEFVPSNVSYASGSFNSSNSDSYSSSESRNEIRDSCIRCSGRGTVTCSACDGRGGREEYSHVPNYSGSTRGSSTARTWHNCSKCGGSGSMYCPDCGGRGTR